MARILVPEKIADAGLEQLRSAGHEVDVQLDLDADGLLTAIVGADALIIRSATQVTAEVIAAATDLQVVGRAGVGLDNVDVDAATAGGVMVVNAPQSNVVSAAEHTMGLLMALARNIPQAHGALVEGRWERSKWNGVELADKTLGIIGLGRIGSLVAARARAFEMRLIAHDPFVTEERARELGVELVTLDEVAARSDFVTTHVAKTPETLGLIGDDFLSKAKPNLRVINVARGGIVDEAALAAAITDGRIAGAALDVYDTEPCTDSPLFSVEGVVVTPHLGASTREAQDKAGVTIAEQVALALAGDFVPFAVNVSARAASETITPYVSLAERLGDVLAALTDEASGQLEIEYAGNLADYDTSLLTLSALKGFFDRREEGQVTFVNVPQIAERAAMTVDERSTPSAGDFRRLITLRLGDHSVAGTLRGPQYRPRIVMVDDHAVELSPADHLLVVQNDDRPGMIGLIGGMVGESGVNIGNMVVGQGLDGVAALMVLVTDRPVSDEVCAELSANEGIRSVRQIGS